MASLSVEILDGLEKPRDRELGRYRRMGRDHLEIGGARSRRSTSPKTECFCLIVVIDFFSDSFVPH